ncbi:MAG: flagellar biosynthesis protein FlhB [Clostridia bacterium]|nr:flagellar biosynthesis protein FlhB [Clostridia bacterium]
MRQLLRDRGYIPLNLQFFSQEKTEEATPKRRQDARGKGQVAKSPEVNSALILLTGFLAIKIFFPYMFEELQNFTRSFLGQLHNTQEFTVDYVMSIGISVIVLSGKMLLPLILTVLVAGIVANYLQVGFLFSTQPLIPKLETLNPITGFKRIFSRRSLMELFKSLIKIGAVGYIVYRAISLEFDIFPKMLDMDIRASLVFIGQLTVKIALQVGLLLLVLAVIDFAFQRWEFNRSLRMSKQEVKEEYKQVEGNPQIKGKIKEKQRQMALRRMMQEVPKADVVITNPTHYALAIKYDGQTMNAPIVVAKGQDLVAQKIKEKAKEHNVAIVENKPLAQALFKSCDIGELIPPELFQAVAEVLAFVYKLRGRA